jgi:hypothetical protein
MRYVNRFCPMRTIMNSRTVRTLLASLTLAALTACGGSGGAVVLTAAGQAQFAAQATAAAPSAPASGEAPMPVASACNDPSCLGGADGLADQFRAASMGRAAQADAADQPGYPNVPSHAMTVAEAQAPEALGTAALMRAQ